MVYSKIMRIFAVSWSVANQPVGTSFCNKYGNHIATNHGNHIATTLAIIYRQTSN